MRRIITLSLVLVFIISAVMVFTGCSKLAGDDADHGTEVVKGMFDAFKAKDYEKAASYFGEGARGINESGDILPILDKIAETTDYKLKSSEEKDGKFEVAVEVTTIDFVAVVDDVKEEFLNDISNLLSGDKSKDKYINLISDSIEKHKDSKKNVDTVIVVKNDNGNWVIDNGNSVISSLFGGLTEALGGINLF